MKNLIHTHQLLVFERLQAGLNYYQGDEVLSKVSSSASFHHRAVAFLYVWFGYAPVETAPLPLERTLAPVALQARIAKEAQKESPVPPKTE
jgi:hypothetical protein